VQQSPRSVRRVTRGLTDGSRWVEAECEIVHPGNKVAAV
jgi:hypothetical protein